MKFEIGDRVRYIGEGKAMDIDNGACALHGKYATECC